MLWSVSSLFGYALPPLLGAKAEWRQSEGRAKAERRHDVSAVCYNYTEKAKKQGAPFEKKGGITLQKASAKKVHFLCRANATSRSNVAPDDNNNNNR